MLPITDDAKGCKEEEPLVLLPLQEDVIFKVNGVIGIVELAKSDKVRWRLVCWILMTSFLFPI